MSKRDELWKEIREDLTSARPTTKSAAAEDGSSLTLRSADELKDLLDLARDEDQAVDPKAGKIRFARTSGPGAY